MFNNYHSLLNLRFNFYELKSVDNLIKFVLNERIITLTLQLLFINLFRVNKKYKHDNSKKSNLNWTFMSF